MPPCGFIHFTRFRKLYQAVAPRGVEKAVAILLTDQFGIRQGPRDEAGDVCAARWSGMAGIGHGDDPDGLEIERPDENRKPIKKPTLWRRKQVVTPVQRGHQRLVARRRGPAPGPKKRKLNAA